MPIDADKKRRPLSILEQAAFVEGVADRATMRDGSVSGEAYLRITSDDVQAMRDLATRLYLMAPLEHAIRRLVTGR